MQHVGIVSRNFGNCKCMRKLYEIVYSLKHGNEVTFMSPILHFMFPYASIVICHIEWPRIKYVSFQFD